MAIFCFVFPYTHPCLKFFSSFKDISHVGLGPTLITSDFPGGSDGKASAYNAGNLGSIPGLEKSPGEGNSNPLQYSCLENAKDRGSWQATSPWDHKESDTTERLHFLFFLSLSNNLILT